ncbi:hypothetical protein VMT65_07530 [Nocardia sp. CDC153]|uniref:hypothetical protein n=1 Tax=Nocardia sp. CDC153 TaxID=3112167 RepID=UPI002DB69B74|nr:hypothetical protein [Nocardia sp. CDC153]MEC3952876.1 hypothetical protein [Nocardia sp. CDC153]
MEFENIPLVEIPPYTGIYSGIAELDGYLALRLLEHNIGNRTLRAGKVAELVRVLHGGQWQFNGEAIKFDRHGTMRDGQHRCAAIVEADPAVPVPALIVFGLEPEAQETMDQGMKRQAFEQLTIAGIDSDKTLAAAVRVLIRWNEGLLFIDHKIADVTTGDVVAWAKANPDGFDMLRELSARGYRRITGCAPSVALAIAYRLAQIDPECAYVFFDSLLKPVGVPDGSPVWALRSRLEQIVKTRQRVPDRNMIGYFISAWNGFREGRAMAKISGPKGGVWTVATFPEPK